jgi:4-hydroxy-3-polyprenylbenzoate decarboxylase
MTRAAMFWEGLERLGIPGIKGVWCHEGGGSLLFNVVSIRQMYAGHSRRVGLVASQISATIGRYTVVVDEDIDPSNLSQVIWAVSTRADPEKSIQILPRCGTSSADTTVSLEEKRRTKGTPKPLRSAPICGTRYLPDGISSLRSYVDAPNFSRASRDQRYEWWADE